MSPPLTTLPAISSLIRLPLYYQQAPSSSLSSSSPFHCSRSSLLPSCCFASCSHQQSLSLSSQSSGPSLHTQSNRENFLLNHNISCSTAPSASASNLSPSWPFFPSPPRQEANAQPRGRSHNHVATVIFLARASEEENLPIERRW